MFTHVGLNLSHGGTDVTCCIADVTMRNTQMDHTECTPSIQLPNTSYRPRFLQGDHHGNANQNLHLAAVYYNGPDRNQCTGEKSKCFSWDCDWTVQYSIPSQVTTLDCGTISLTSYNVPVVFMSLLNTVAVCSKHFISKLRDFSMVGWLCSLTYMEIMSTIQNHSWPMSLPHWDIYSQANSSQL